MIAVENRYDEAIISLRAKTIRLASQAPGTPAFHTFVEDLGLQRSRSHEKILETAATSDSNKPLNNTGDIKVKAPVPTRLDPP
jgi:hypothetical protein